MRPPPRAWTFLSNHAHVVLAIDAMPGATVRQIAAHAAITERETYSILGELEAAGYLSRERVGRRASLTLHLDRPMRPPLEGRSSLRQMVEALRRDTGI